MIDGETELRPESADPFDVVVIGGGPAGVTAALRAAELGARTVVVERDRLGGTCTDDGCAPTRVLAKAARLVRDAQASPAFGVTAARPEVDLREALASAQRVIYGLHQKKQLRAHLEAVGAVVVPKEDAAGALREELEEHAKEKLADFKVPKHIFFVEDLPRNAAGKILKRELREEFADKASSESG